MSSVAALLGAVALLLAGLALLLWQRGHVRQRQASVTRFVEARVAAVSAGVHVAPPPLTGGTPAQGARAAAQRAVAPFSRWRARVATAIDHLLRRAGIADARRPFAIAAVLTVLVCVAALAELGALAACGAFLFACGLIAFVLSQRIHRRRVRLIVQLPSFLDGIVRLIVLGNSVPAAFQAAHQNTEAPLRECLDHVSRMLRSGIEIDRALHQASVIYRARELELVGAVLRLSVKYGGRADVMLERMATFMRDLEQAQRELVAMTAETRLSAWVLGVLPLGLACFMIFANPRYFNAMWGDASGRSLVYAALGLQALGVYLLYRLTRLRG